MKKFTSFTLLAAIALFTFASCSKTREGLGLDTINNNARTDKWEVTHLTYITGTTEPITDPVIDGYEYAEFKSDNQIHYFDDNRVDVAQVSYSFLDTKSMLYNGEEFTIQENLAGSFSRMTLQRETTTGREVYIFQRP